MSGTNKAAMDQGKMTEVAMFGAGCFWCTEAIFQRQAGVVQVQSGYSGGHVTNPTYRAVCEGKTGHAEVVRITFDPGIVSYKQLLSLFWEMHDPTTLNRQGADVGTQYRSVIYCLSESQRKDAEDSKAAMQAAGRHDSPIVTSVEMAGPFYPAEEYHQDYFDRNPNAPYCRMVIAPKVEKVRKGKGAAHADR